MGRYDRLGLTEGFAREAGEPTEEHALRGFDAVHLASALRLVQRFPNSAFLVFDERLSAAAEHASLPVSRP